MKHGETIQVNVIIAKYACVSIKIQVLTFTDGEMPKEATFVTPRNELQSAALVMFRLQAMILKLCPVLEGAAPNPSTETAWGERNIAEANEALEEILILRKEFEILRTYFWNQVHTEHELESSHELKLLRLPSSDEPPTFIVAWEGWTE